MNAPRSLGAALAFVLLAAPLGLDARADAHCAAADPTLPVLAPTLSVALTAARPSYTRGQVASLTVEVHRLVQAGPKVAGADIQVAVSAGTRLVATLYAKTDGSGIAHPALKIPKSVRTGKLTAVATARELLAQGYDCSGLAYHSGQATADPLLRVR